MSSSGRDPEVARRVLANARAAERDRLRGIARRDLGPDASDEDVEARVIELIRAKLSAAGKAGRARQAQELDKATRARAALTDLEELLAAALDRVRLAMGDQ